MYQVEIRRLNEQVKRNGERFPEDFMFQLSEEEYENLRSQIVTSSLEEDKSLRSQNVTLENKGDSLRSQIATLDKGRGKYRKYMPYAFTENGVYMLSAVLKSQIAIDVSIEIMRTFTKLREFSLHYNALAKKILELERKNDKQFKEVFDILDELVSETKKTDEKIMGFIR